MEANLTNIWNLIVYDQVQPYSNNIQTMGGEVSKRKEELIDLIKDYPYHRKDSITEQEFVYDVFHLLDLTKPQSYGGYLFVSGTHILKLYFQHLVTQNRGALSRKNALNAIEQIYDDPKLAIECSYKLMQSDNNPNITKAQFISFVINCFDMGIESIIKESRCERQFKQNFREWTKKTKPSLMASIEKVFQDNAQSMAEEWTQGDFKRWILNGDQWSIYVQLKGVPYNIPLNVPCLLGVKLK